MEAKLLKNHQGFGLTTQLDGGANTPSHQAPGAEIGQHIHGGDVHKGEEHCVAIGMQGASGVKGSDGLMDGGVSGEGDDGHGNQRFKPGDPP